MLALKVVCLLNRMRILLLKNNLLQQGLTIKLAVENASNRQCVQLALSLMASLVDQMNTKEMGKTELIASFVSSIVYILQKS